jgi:4-amino-4-deoxy-L-arabinose transferase-like glycosyltransferase
MHPDSAPTSRWRWATLLVFAAYVVLAVSFSLGPIFEAPDEIEHYRFIRTVAQTGALPDPRGQFRGQLHQAPLYYMLLAPFAALLPDGDFTQIDGRLNPYYPHLIGVPGNDNKNLYLHTRAEDFPYAGSQTARAVHLLRLPSVALGLLTLLVGLASFRLLWPERPDRQLMALGIAACLPQFTYLSGSINNDNLLFALTSLSLYLLLRLRHEGPSVALSVVIGVCLGAAILTKLNALFLVFPVGLVVLTDRRMWWPHAPLILGVVALVAGWWFLRNGLLYGDPTLIRTLLTTWQAETIRDGELAFDVGLSRIGYSYQTFWARFGQGAVAVGAGITAFFDALTVLAAAGIALGLIRRRVEAPRNLLLVAVFALTWVGALIYYASTAWSGNQGRYLLPGIVGWAALIAFGLDAFTPRRLRRVVALSGVALLATIGAVCVYGYFLPSYRPSPIPPRLDRQLSLRFGDAADLIGMSPAAPHGRPGQIIEVTLYWRALRPVAAAQGGSVQSYLHSVGSAVVKRDSLPATGNLLSTDWKLGETWAERYVIQLPPSAEIQHVYPLVAGLYDPGQGRALAATSDGAPVEPVIGRIAITGGEELGAWRYRLGEGIGLAEPDIQRDGSALRVCLTFRALSSVAADYSIFVHLLPDASGPPLAQADAQPKGNAYPTSAWQAGETVRDCLQLDLPPDRVDGAAQIGIGLYDPNANARLPVRDGSGGSLSDDMVRVSVPPR